MQQEPIKEGQNSLPYEPIKFVYTETIGSVLQKFKEIIDPYTWAYQDILEPKILTNPSKVQYYLFHIAPIYNWLRQVESNILANYLRLEQNGGNPASINKPTFSVQKGSEYKKFDQKSFDTQIKHYLQQWQIVKLCTCAKVRIITTKTDQLTQQSNKFNKNSHNNMKAVEARCTHMIKKQKFTSEYRLNDFTPSNIKLQCSMVFCDDCQQYIKVKAEITRYPFAPYFAKYYGKQFILNDNSSSKLVYQLAIVYGQQNSYVKSSGGVWYQISKDKTAVVSYDKIQLKSGLIFVYQQTVNSNKILRKAQPLRVKQNLNKKLQQISHNDEQYSQQESLPLKSDRKQQKPMIRSKNLKDSQSSQIQSTKVQKSLPDDEILEDMSKNPLPIILNKKNTDRKLFKQYKKTVQGLLPKQREKDQYQKNYDKGKTKKIHKNRQQFRTADFFKLYKDIKNKDHNQTSSNDANQKEQDQNLHSYTRQRSNKPNGTFKQKDEEYNDVYQDRRNQRRSRGHFGSKFGNKFNKNRHNPSKGGNKFEKKGHGKNFRKQ